MSGVARHLAALALNCGTASLLTASAPAATIGAVNLLLKNGFSVSSTASEAFSRKDVIYNLDNSSDPEAEAAIKAFQREQFAAAAKGTAKPAEAEPDLELASKIERKYMAAQVVESGIQNIAVPLSYEAEGGIAAVKRYVAQLQNAGAQAGFKSPAVELDSKLSEVTKGAETAKDLLARMKPYTSADYHTALTEALATVESETGGAVLLDGASAGYKKFADKVKVSRNLNESIKDHSSSAGICLRYCYNTSSQQHIVAASSNTLYAAGGPCLYGLPDHVGCLCRSQESSIVACC